MVIESCCGVTVDYGVTIESDFPLTVADFTGH